MSEIEEVFVGHIDELDDPGCREFTIGDGDWPFRGFVVRQGDAVVAYKNFCMHAGHPLNWKPDSFLTKDNAQLICASHGALYDIATGLCTAGPCTGKYLVKVDVEVDEGVIKVRGPNSLR